jgi:hypothetical protein
MSKSTQTPDDTKKKCLMFFIKNVLITIHDGISFYVEGRHFKYVEPKKKS